jgi:hypothetical protein
MLPFGIDDRHATDHGFERTALDRAIGQAGRTEYRSTTDALTGASSIVWIQHDR